MNKYLIIVAGPTAVGKTALCVQLAQALQTEIISADARQLYQGMKIGTAQPTKLEQQGVPHHFIGELPVIMPYSAGQFEQDALQKLRHLFSQHPIAILTGGSGLYIQAVCEGLDAMPPTDLALRATLNERCRQEGLGALTEELRQRDPVYYAQVDRCNPQRVIRALEINITTGRSYTAFRSQSAAKRPFQIIKIGLERDRALLYQRIEQRVDQMLEDGLWQEATALYPYRAHRALQTLGYREIFTALEGQHTDQEAVALIKQNTRRYAKRQLTWLKRDAEMQWFCPDRSEEILAYIQQQLGR